MTITLDEDIAIDLIETKLQLLDAEITAILQKWGKDTIDDFLEAARTGIIEEAEDDAIDMTNLRDRRDEISKLLENRGQ
jgi:hypothetical protein